MFCWEPQAPAPPSRRSAPTTCRCLARSSRNRIGPPPSRKADAAAPAVVAAPAVDASRYAASTLKLPWTSPSEFIAGLEKLFGKELVASLTGKVQPEQVGPSPSLQPDAEALPLVPHLTLPASPDTGSAAQPLPAAGPSEPPAWRWTGPLNPPQATCDEQGRLIIPDRTEYNERVRRGMSGEQLWRRMD